MNGDDNLSDLRKSADHQQRSTQSPAISLPERSHMVKREVKLTPDQLADVASGTPLRVDRLSLGERYSHIRQYQLSGSWGFDAMSIKTSVLAEGPLSKEFAVILAIAYSRGSIICGVPLEDSMIVVIPPGSEVKACIREDALYSGTMIPAAYWLEVQEIVAGYSFSEFREGPCVFNVPNMHPHRLIRFMDEVSMALQGYWPLRNDRTVPPVLHEFLAFLILNCVQIEDRYEAINRSASARIRQAWRARDYVESHLSSDLTIEALCNVAAVSRRQLEYAFHTTFGIGPQKFIQIARLNAIRRELFRARKQNLTVTEVALEHGIQHLGRFSQNYRELFGEVPSDTFFSGMQKR